MKSTNILILSVLILATLASCNNDKDKAMQEALDKAGIKISQQDSIIASQMYRCNYVITYYTDTAFYKIKDGKLLKGRNKTLTGDSATFAIHAIPNPYSGGYGLPEYPKKGTSESKLHKHFTVIQVDSTMSSIWKANTIKDTVIVTAYEEEDGKLSLRSRKEYREVSVHLTVEKNYDNLYNAKKQD